MSKLIDSPFVAGLQETVYVPVHPLTELGKDELVQARDSLSRAVSVSHVTIVGSSSGFKERRDGFAEMCSFDNAQIRFLREGSTEEELSSVVRWLIREDNGVWFAITQNSVYTFESPGFTRFRFAAP
jgi:hypothetical protein